MCFDDIMNYSLNKSKIVWEITNNRQKGALVEFVTNKEDSLIVLCPYSCKSVDTALNLTKC